MTVSNAFPPGLGRSSVRRFGLPRRSRSPNIVGHPWCFPAASGTPIMPTTYTRRVSVTASPDMGLSEVMTN